MKVVVTGLGAICAIGSNIKSLWDSIEQGRTGISPIRRFDVEGFNTDLGALIPEDDHHKTEIDRIWAMGKNVIFDIDVVGGLRIKKKYPNKTLAVFVKPPSVDELKIRLKKRKTESEEKINMRIAKASVELATAPQFDHIIENKILEVALEDSKNLVLQFIAKDHA